MYSLWEEVEEVRMVRIAFVVVIEDLMEVLGRERGFVQRVFAERGFG